MSPRRIGRLLTRSTRSLLALALAAGVASPAAGGCCDDFWSCAGAVATGGLSCAAQAALDALQALIRQTTATRDTLNARYEAELQAELETLRSEIAQVDAEIRDLMRQVDAALADGDRILHEDQDGIRTSVARARAGLSGNPPPSTGASLVAPGPRTGPTPTPSASRAVLPNLAALQALQADPTLQQLRQRLDELKKEKEAIVAQILKKEATVGGLQMAAANAAADQARAAYAAQILKPIGDVLGVLEAALANPLDAGGVVRSAITLLDDAARGLESLVVRFVGAIEQAGNASLAVVQPEVDALRKVADEARRILATMQKMTALKTAAARQALAKSLPAAVPATRTVPRALKSPASLADRARALGTGLAALPPEFRRFAQTRASVDVIAFRPRLASDFDGFFRGKSPADAKRKRAELVAEARRRFASDPKTLAAVERLLNDEARARGVPL